MKALRLCLLFSLLPLALACARSGSSTVVADDGSWTRTLKLSIQKSGMTGEPGKFEETFILPSGPQWKTSQVTEKENLVFTAIRNAKLGESIAKDLQIVEKGKVVCMNEVKVTLIAPGRYEYLETVKYVGAEKPETTAPKKELIPILKKCLPAGTSEEVLNQMADEFFVAVWRMIWGPTEPLLPQLMFSPELAERRLKAKFGKVMDGLMAKHLGGTMDANARLTAIRAIVKELDSDKLMQGEKEKKKEESGGGNDSLVSVFASVKLPGRIIESNGETDEISGEVYWAFFPESAQIGDVVLRAVCEVTP